MDEVVDAVVAEAEIADERRPADARALVLAERRFAPPRLEAALLSEPIPPRTPEKHSV